MSKRPPIDLMALTSLTTEQAAPMPEAVQRSTSAEQPGRGTATAKVAAIRIPTENLADLNFKVPPEFKKRYRLCAAREGLKLNQLLFRALDAWEEKHGQKS